MRPQSGCPLAAKKNSSMRLFPDTVYWRLLHPDATMVAEPANPSFAIARAPTVPEVDARLAPPPPKYNYSELFDIPVFKGVSTTYEFNCRGKIRKGADGKPLTNCVPREEGCVDPGLRRSMSYLLSWRFGSLLMYSFH